MNCPHREPCQQCREMEREMEQSSHRIFAAIFAVLAAVLALFAFICACGLDPRANAWAGIAIGCVFMYLYNTAAGLRRRL